MKKSDAIRDLGGTVKQAAAEVGITEEAIRAWPDPLPPRIADRVQAALWRRYQASQQAASRDAAQACATH